MKKLLLIAASAGAFLASETSVQAMATPGTQVLGGTTVAMIGIGTGLWAMGRWGAANTIGTLIAGTVGLAATYITDCAIQGAIATELCPLFLATNPMVAPLVIGAIVGGLMFWLRKDYLPSHSKKLEEFGSILLKAGITLGSICAVSYAANIIGYEFGSPLYKIVPTPNA